MYPIDKYQTPIKPLLGPSFIHGGMSLIISNIGRHKSDNVKISSTDQYSFWSVLHGCHTSDKHQTRIIIVLFGFATTPPHECDKYQTRVAMHLITITRRRFSP